MYLVETVKYNAFKTSDTSVVGTEIDQSWKELETESHQKARAKFNELKKDIKGFTGYGIILSIGDDENGYCEQIDEHKF